MLAIDIARFVIAGLLFSIVALAALVVCIVLLPFIIVALIFYLL